MPAQVDAADDVVERIVFIDPHHVQDGLPVRLHRHAHGDAQPPLGAGGAVGGQVVRLPEEGEKAVLQAVRRAAGSLDQAAVQAVEGDGVQLIDLGGLGERLLPALAERAGLIAGGRVHAGVSGDGHHPVRQHVDVGLHLAIG